MSGLVPWARGPQSVFAQSPSMLTPYRQPEFTPPSPTAPGSLRDWWRELNGVAVQESPPTAVESAVIGLRQNAEGAAIGALLALIDTDLGGLDLGGRIPLDWAGAALFYGLSIHDTTKGSGLSLDYRAMGQSCTTVAMYRTVHRWREAKKGIPRNNPQLTGDPVLAAGKSAF
jgi:hypothetical protein